MRTRYQLTVIASAASAVIAATLHGCGSDSDNEGTGGAGGAGGMNALGGNTGTTSSPGGTTSGGATGETTHSGTAGAGGAGGAGGALAAAGASGGTTLAGAAGMQTAGAAGRAENLPGTAGMAGNRSGGAGGVVGSAGNAGSAGSGAAAGHTAISFFVTSDTSATGNLGGLVGADARCQALAIAAGNAAGTWHAYLSAEVDPSNANQPTNARDRIGRGPWYNANGLLVARNVTELHAMKGNADVFVDERGVRISGQWTGSPRPVEHDILTGSNPDGSVLTGFTCDSWTSASTSTAAQVGHSDGLGPSMNPNPPYDSWNSSHTNESCANTTPRGGAGRLYCFLVN